LRLDNVGFTPEQLRTLQIKLANKINDEGFLYADCNTQRSQTQNKVEVIARMRGWIEEALTPEIERKPTKPTHGSQVRRLETETILKEKKQNRREGKQLVRRGHDED
jgi:protein subunit release factor B